TIANFKEKAEIEQGRLIQAYLRQAISCFAASESTPPHPPIPTNTRPVKGNRYAKYANPNNISTMIAPKIDTTRASQYEIKENTALLPQKPPTKENLWTSVAKRGNKKSRVNPTPVAVNRAVLGPKKNQV
ncbi:putative eka-like protein, partial [Golovinomyces cichoracearum]